MFQKTYIFSELFNNFFLIFKTSKPWKYQFYLGKTTIFKVFAKNVFLQFSSIFGSKNLPKTLPKRSPNDEKIDAKNVLFFNIDFLGFRPRFWSLLGLQDGAKLAQNRKKSGLGMVWVWSSKPSLNRCLKKWRLGGLQARFWKPWASILEAQGSILSEVLDVANNAWRAFWVANTLPPTCPTSLGHS